MRISVSVSAETAETLKELAESRGETVSALVERLVELAAQT